MFEVPLKSTWARIKSLYSRFDQHDLPLHHIKPIADAFFSHVQHSATYTVIAPLMTPWQLSPDLTVRPHHCLENKMETMEDITYISSITTLFPYFNGSEPLEWLYTAELYFETGNIDSDTLKLQVALSHTVGNAWHWFSSLYRLHKIDMWEHFLDEFTTQYGLSEYRHLFGDSWKLHKSSQEEAPLAELIPNIPLPDEIKKRTNTVIAASGVKVGSYNSQLMSKDQYSALDQLEVSFLELEYSFDSLVARMEQTNTQGSNREPELVHVQFLKAIDKPQSDELKAADVSLSTMIPSYFQSMMHHLGSSSAKHQEFVVDIIDSDLNHLFEGCFSGFTFESEHGRVGCNSIVLLVFDPGIKSQQDVVTPITVEVFNLFFSAHHYGYVKPYGAWMIAGHNSTHLCMIFYGLQVILVYDPGGVIYCFVTPFTAIVLVAFNKFSVYIENYFSWPVELNRIFFRIAPEFITLVRYISTNLARSLCKAVHAADSLEYHVFKVEDLLDDRGWQNYARFLCVIGKKAAALVVMWNFLNCAYPKTKVQIH